MSCAVVVGFAVAAARVECVADCVVGDAEFAGYLGAGAALLFEADDLLAAFALFHMVIVVADGPSGSPPGGPSGCVWSERIRQVEFGEDLAHETGLLLGWQ